jgi:hypothetical protein
VTMRVTVASLSIKDVEVTHESRIHLAQSVKIAIREGK